MMGVTRAAGLASAIATTVAASGDYASLVTFDGEPGTSFKWRLINDPVMGGLSRSVFNATTAAKTAQWDGIVEIVPSLQAPGFCQTETSAAFGINVNSAAGFDSMLVRMKSLIPFDGWKLSFAANTNNPLFGSFKSDFVVTADGEWHDYILPFKGFSNDWSSATGEPNTRCFDDPSVCPNENDLASIQQVALWAEGAAGNFSAEFEYVRAVNKNDHKDWDDFCTGDIQPNLRYNMSNISPDGLVIPPAADESLAEAICCDNKFMGSAEPRFTFERQDVNLFGVLDPNQDRTEDVIFYDPVCGLPLFNVTTNPAADRSFSIFREETEEHGWPSFRPSEIVDNNVYLVNNKYAYSTCGTYLGTNEADDLGTRYCLDLSCVSGNPKA